MRPTHPSQGGSPDGPCKSTPSKFRNFIPSPEFPAERGRYVLYVNVSCDWCHRTIIARALKGLEDIVHLVEVDYRDRQHGWRFSGRRGPSADPFSGVKYLRELYLKSDSNYNGRVTVPLLWDSKTETIVNNESSDIVRIFFDGFDDFLPVEQREKSKGEAAFIPAHLREKIESCNAWVYDTINNGVYKVGFALSQGAYEEHITKLFQSLDRLEYHMSVSNSPYLFAGCITESDIFLYTTLVRFDVVYYTLFKCNIKMIRHDYPHLHMWLRRLYWDEGPSAAGGVFKTTTEFAEIKRGYASVVPGNTIIPAGPVPYILPL